MMTTETKRYTPDDLLCMTDGHRFELVAGELVERNMGFESDALAFEFNRRIGDWIARERPGWGFQAQTGLRIFPWDPDLVRYADGGYIGREKGARPGRGHLAVAPDLIIEVVSPNDEFESVETKVADYLRAGVRLVWVVVPETRWVHIYRADGSSGLVRQDGEIEGEDVLPGFRCALAEVFSAIA